MAQKVGDIAHLGHDSRYLACSMQMLLLLFLVSNGPGLRPHSLPCQFTCKDRGHLDPSSCGGCSPRAVHVEPREDDRPVLRPCGFRANLDAQVAALDGLVFSKFAAWSPVRDASVLEHIDGLCGLQNLHGVLLSDENR